MEASTLKWFNSTIKNLINYTSDIRIDQLTPHKIYEWHQTTSERTTAVTANNNLRALKIILQRLLNAGYLAHNPAQHVAYIEEPPRQPRAIHHDTYQKLRNHADIRMTAILDLFWSSGCRLSELTSIQIATTEFWQLNGRLCFAAVVIGKGRLGRYRGQRSRHIYADSDQANSIQNWLQQRPQTAVTDQLFTTIHGHALNKSTISANLRQLRIKASILPNTISNPHSFRHAFAIRKLNEGHDLAAVSAWLGHSDPAFTAATYLTRTETQLRDKYFGNGR